MSESQLPNKGAHGEPKALANAPANGADTQAVAALLDSSFAGCCRRSSRWCQPAKLVPKNHRVRKVKAIAWMDDPPATHGR
jgi:hypothetical protein